MPHFPSHKALPFTQTRASFHLDAVRGLAAVAVLLSHWRALLFVDFGSLSHTEKIIWAPLYLLTQGGHLAVIIFFVLSGYLISGSIFRSLHKGTFTIVDYGSHRVIRLWVVLLPALALGGILDFVGLHHEQALTLYHGLAGNHTTIDAFTTLNPLGALRSAVFLQTIRGGGVFGSNVPLWSVAYEFWYYVLFPAACIVVLKGWSVPSKILSGLVFIAVCALVGPSVLAAFPFWLAGVSLHFLPSLKLERKHRALAAASYGVLFIILSAATHFLPEGIAGYVLGIFMTLLTVGFLWVLLSSSRAQDGLYEKGSRALAGFSYTLYTIHFPILMLFTAFSLGSERWHPSPLSFAYALGALALVFAITLAMHRVFERNTPEVQGFANRVIEWGTPEKVESFS